MREVKTYYYEEGNVVRQVEAPLSDRYTRERERQEERERQLRRKRHQQAVAARKRKFYSFYLAVASIALVGLFVGYVNLTNSITTHRNNIASLEQDISDLKASNSATESRIASQSNLNDIKNQALNEMGMVYANQDQIVYYTMDNNDYMNQYNNIP